MRAKTCNDAELLARLRERYPYVLRLKRAGKRTFVVVDDDGLFEAHMGDEIRMYRSVLYINGSRLRVREQAAEILSDGSVLLGLAKRQRHGTRRRVP